MTDKQHKGDLDRVSSQNSATDLVRGVEDGPQGGFLNGLVRSVIGATPVGRAVASRTDFGQRDFDLNKMIDLVEQTDPEDLESSGSALWDARDAIKAAADELSGHIDNVHWVGRSGTSFRTWGADLVANTVHLSEFAGAAGDQITAAAVGLASVRGAMPPRDTVLNRKRPEFFTATEKTANKEGYAAAVRVEKDRQEAINQMNRLASYYAVSEEALSSLPAKEAKPTFTAMPDVGVPRPRQLRDDSRSVSVPGSHGGTESAAPAGHHAVTRSDAPRQATRDSVAPMVDTPRRVTYPDTPVGTNIDSTGMLPAPTTTPATGHTPPILGTPPTNTGQPPVFEGPFGTPIPSGPSGRGLSGAGGFRTPPSAQGRVGTPGLSNRGSGRAAGQGPMNEMGRATSTGQSVTRGSAAGPKASPMGRGVTGGMPRAGGTAAPRATSGPVTGAGRSNGVVGGRPTTTGGASAKDGSRIPRGTVIGGEEEANSRSTTGRIGQRGVFGTPQSTARPGSSAAGSRAGAGTSEAVTSRPTARNSAAGAERNGMTRGGSGLVRGAGHGEKSREDRNTQGESRPDYLVEDVDTHMPNEPRRDVPPVVN